MVSRCCSAYKPLICRVSIFTLKIKTCLDRERFMTHKEIDEEKLLFDLSGLEKKTVYISGPVTSSGWVIHHLRKAIDTANKLAEEGFIPYIPHTTVLWDLIYPEHDYNFWLYTVTLPWVARCDFLLRLPGESFGADREVSLAYFLDKKVFYSLEDLVAYKKEVEKCVNP